MKEDDKPLPAFSAVGIELEYMIVDRETLAVRPLADRLLGADGEGGLPGSALAWSNELVLHVIEIKNPRPAASLDDLPAAFQHEVGEINARLSQFGACLLPSSMHPRMDPRTETRLWPHGNEAIYRAYDRIFDSRSHGWANLQSMHVNLPFAGDEEFARLHAAIRLVLPVLPALAASSPVADGGLSGWADYRMRVYCDNADNIPCIAGMVIPETVSSRAEYEQVILAPMYRAIAPYDPEGVLQHEWLNSRGAIARFSRSAIEIRVIDTQECPQADLAVAAACIEAVRGIYERGAAELARQQDLPTGALAGILGRCMRDADEARIDNPLYLSLLGYEERECSAGELWRHLAAPLTEPGGRWADTLQVLLGQGPLARRIMRALDGQPDRIDAVYRELGDCLREGRLFVAA